MSPRAVNRETGAGRRVSSDYVPTEDEILKPLQGEEVLPEVVETTDDEEPSE